MWFKAKGDVRDGAFRRLAHKVDLELLARLAKADCLGREPGVFSADAAGFSSARSLGVDRRPPVPALSAATSDLGVKPGPRMGEILKAVDQQQLDGKVRTLEDAVAAARTLL